MSDTRLIEAVKVRDIDRVKELFESDADVDQQDENGWTPLNWAAGKGELAIVKLLLEKGADVLKVGRDQRTPYLIALAAAHVEVAKLLREAEDRAGGESRSGRKVRKYCKAYHIKELRKFSGWSESRINRKEQEEQGGEGEVQNEDRVFPDDDIVYIHQDLTVTQSMFHSENIIFNQVTPGWEEFCSKVLKFEVPDDFDLVPRDKPAGRD